MAKVTALDTASQRLSDAFSLLEQRIDAAKAQPSIEQDLAGQWQQHVDHLQAETNAITSERDELQRENEHLRNELHSLKQEYLQMQRVYEKVAARIDEQASQLELIAG